MVRLLRGEYVIIVLLYYVLLIQDVLQEQTLVGHLLAEQCRLQTV